MVRHNILTIKGSVFVRLARKVMNIPLSITKYFVIWKIKTEISLVSLIQTGLRSANATRSKKLTPLIRVKVRSHCILFGNACNNIKRILHKFCCNLRLYKMTILQILFIVHISNDLFQIDSKKLNFYTFSAWLNLKNMVWK